jgi:MFS family permease
VFQGLGGAMMVPVGRLVLLRSIPKSEMVNSLAYLTVPALIGPVVGPPLGGFITTYFHWRWIFWINVPIGILGVVLALRFIDNIHERDVGRFDFQGFWLSGLGLLSLIFGMTIVGRGLVPLPVVACLVGGGAILLALYVAHARREPNAILDLSLLKFPTFFAGVVGGFLFRLGIGAIPFLLPLLLQIGFGLSPFESGSLTFAAAAGAMAMKFSASTLIRRFGFRRILIFNALLSSAFLAAYGLVTASTPHWLLLAGLLAGGYFRSLEFTALNAISYADVDQARMSRATSFASVSQQMSSAVGVAVAAASVESLQWAFGDVTLVSRDMAYSFGVVALVSLSSVVMFLRLRPDAGAEVSGAMRDEPAPAAAQ